MYGRIVRLCLAVGPACWFCLSIRRMIYGVLGLSTTVSGLRTRLPSLSPIVLPLDGLSGGELLALATEGRRICLRRGNKMDLLMKIIMGGWLPEGKRTQWAAFFLFVGTLMQCFLDWGTGAHSLVEILPMLAEKWKAFVASAGLYFLGEKINGYK